uniref:Cilia- and flagella-associated protein 43 n=1 Tax=Amphilophus citrinellus TaxID=61819 RepID=A0A3Q0R7J7_AMPCI
QETNLVCLSGNSGIFAFSEEKLSPSIFVYSFPNLQLKNELKGKAELDYTSLALSDSGPYLGSCSSLPDHIITVWNWENAEPLCTQPQAGQDVISLAFNPMNWLQLCALGTTSLTVWNIERSDSLHILQPSLAPSSQTVSSKLQVKPSTRARLTPSAICWTATSELYVGCAEGFLLLADPESRSHIKHQNVAHCLQIKGTQINIAQTWQLERPVTTVTHSPDYKTLLLSSNTVPALLHDDKNICVVKHLCCSRIGVTCLACCPIAHYAAVGTATGKVLFIDLNQEHRPRLVHQVYLYHSAVDHLVFDHDGHYLFTSGSDSHVYILDAKPSRMFSVIGCTGPGSVDRHGCLSSHVLRVFRFRYDTIILLSDASSQDTGNFSNQQAVELKPEQEVRGHPLGPASLVLSPHRLWLASVGRDGLLRIRETASMVRCHSCDLDGVRSVSFSTDSCTLLTVGLKDGSLIREMIGDSENQPEQHFNLDVEEQWRLEAMVETEIEWDIVEKCYLRDIIKRECWDTMKVIGRTVKAFHSDLEVLNYPLRERTEAELENLCRVSFKASCLKLVLVYFTGRAQDHMSC